MSALKILTVVGTRPQFIKSAVVSRAISEHNIFHPMGTVEEEKVHTGQHYDEMLSRVFFEELKIPPPEVNLNVGSGSHGEVTGAMLAGIEKQISAREPDLVLVYGDSNSTLAGALAAAKMHVPVGHVEAGLRSLNRKMPENINRILTDHLSDYLFCPSRLSKIRLAREGITRGVHVVGDVMYDAVLHYRDKAIRPERQKPFALASLHRAENTDAPERLRRILSAMGHSPVPVILPLHPRTRKAIEREGITVNRRLEIMEPLSYLSMLGHLEGCAFVMTDSGGLQKEAYFLGKKCIIVRDETEWTELVECGANRVVGTEESAIRGAFSWVMEPLQHTSRPYGRGNAGKRIIRHLEEAL